MLSFIEDHSLYFLQNPYPYDVNASHQVLYFRKQDPSYLDLGEEFLRRLAEEVGIDPIQDMFCMQNILALRSVPVPHIHVFSTKPLTVEPIVF